MSRPTLFIVCGLTGSGKTTIATALSKHTCGIVLTSAAVIKELFVTTTNEGQDKDFSPEEIDIGYRAMHLLARLLLASGKSVILDGIYRSRAQRAAALAVARATGVPARLLLVECPEAIAKERLERRLASGSEPGGYRNRLFFHGVFEPVTEKHDAVDSSQDVEPQLLALLKKKE